MALGGGTFTTQNKVLPGAYINFVSASRVNDGLPERGVAALPVELDWGADGEIITVTSKDFNDSALMLFGYPTGHEKMKGIRDLMKGASTAYLYKLNTGGTKASNTIATALYTGTRGNDIKTSVQANEQSTESNSIYDVCTYLDGMLVDMQTVKTAAELIPNSFVTFKTDATLALSAGTALTGGANGTVTNDSYQTFLDKIESYAVNVVGCLSSDTSVKALFAAYTRRMRDEVGVKMQCVLHKYEAANYEGVISVENNTDSSLVYWVTGAEAGCSVSASLMNKTYDGEYPVDTNYTQAQLEASLKAGKFMLHKVGDEIRVLKDINTLTTYTSEKGTDFADNQVIRVLDQIGNDIASLFNNQYLGKIPNDASGRVSLWNDIVKHHQQLERAVAIENFDPANVVVEKGQTKKSVVVKDQITPVSAMEQLYMTVVVQ